MVRAGLLAKGVATGYPELLSGIIPLRNPCDVVLPDLDHQVRIYQACLDGEKLGVLYSHIMKDIVLFSLGLDYPFAFHLFISPTA